MIITDHPALPDIAEDTPVLIDGEIGNFYVDPSEEVVERFEARNAARTNPGSADMKAKTHTRNGTRVYLWANLNLLSEGRLARELKAEAIGLYRSEFPFLVRRALPTEEEQVVIYRRLVHETRGLPLTVGTLDFGGDKSMVGAGGEDNPALGLRSIRFSLAHPELFRQQLRAILRGTIEASKLNLLFPMVGGADEFRAARSASRGGHAVAGPRGIVALSPPAPGRDDRGTKRRAHGRGTRARSGFLQHRHEQSGPVPAGRRSRQCLGYLVLSSRTSGGTARPAPGRGGGPAKP
jgi:phosphoenolpyruvate-protein kinase (PTS system EI component)